ncbi:hypothetical protein Vadar_005820 [Vaccinium darrowii]|uniref:Uncharacterized protein n=1 Tax=Vaccinium darrowii TaxID=229202 RepID=A0ACB7ZA75_9ERIC|nr:hypothetical protein Vadar_005820 [Vaccinium darrowii]
MRCKKHLTDLTSSIGVCATCLTERLSALIDAQALAEGAQLARSLKADHQQDRFRKSDAGHPPPLVFPRSVSPYISHRKSDYARPNQHHQHTLSDQLFFSTPQLGPTVVPEEPKSGNFCLLSRLFFRSRPASASSSSTRPSWFSNMLYSPSRRQKREPNRSSVDGDRRPQRRWRSDRGMSPARVSDCRGDDAECGEYSSEEWKQTPQRPTATPLRRGGHSRNVSGLKFCLSPLVRASPSWQWNQKGIMQPEVSIHGEVRVPAVGPRLSTGAANRSRKIADFGRCNHGHR